MNHNYYYNHNNYNQLEEFELQVILNPNALDICIMFEVEDPRRDAVG